MSTSPLKVAKEPRRLATQNVKFERMLDDLFMAKLKVPDVKDRIIKYVQVLETNYTEVVRELKDQIKKKKSHARDAVATVTNFVMERSELERLFLDCINHTRQQIMAQRLKQEFLMS